MNRIRPLPPVAASSMAGQHFVVQPEDRMTDIEIGIAMLEGDNALGLGDLGVAATAKNYNRLVEKVKKLKADLKAAPKGGGKERRLRRRLERAQRKLAAIRQKARRQEQRREGKGKDLKKYQIKRKAAISGRRRSVTLFKAYKAAQAVGWPKNLRVTPDWVEGVAKPKNFTVFVLGVLKAYRLAVTRMRVSGETWAVAVPAAAQALKTAEIRSIVARSLLARGFTLGLIAQESANKSRVVAKGARSVPATQAQPAPLVRQRMLALRARRQQILAAKAQAQREAQLQQEQMMRNLQEALRAQQSQRAAEIRRQQQQYTFLYQQQLAKYQQELQANMAEEQQASGAFQAFPYSTPLEQDQAEDAPESPEDDSFDSADAGEEGEDGEDMGGGDSEETPFYTKPWFLVAVVGGAGIYAYRMRKGKKADKAS